jgi:hypothetical protein
MTLSFLYLSLLLVSIIRITIYIHGIYTPLIIHCCFNHITLVIKSFFYLSQGGLWCTYNRLLCSRCKGEQEGLEAEDLTLKSCYLQPRVPQNAWMLWA